MIPTIGCGTYRLSSLDCFEAMQEALRLGYRHIDTAMAYDNEAAVGRAIDVSPVSEDELFLTTKVKGYPEYLHYDSFLQAAMGCIDRLGVDTLDLLLVHWWHPEGDMEETCAALDRLVDEGFVRHIGMSNFSIDRMTHAMEYLNHPIVTNQLEYHVYRSRPDLLEFCRDHDILLTAYSPLAEGRLATDDRLARIGARYDKSAAQVAVRWLIQQEGIVTIPKASSTAHQRENLEVFDFELSPAHMAEIEALEGPLWYRLNTEGGAIQRMRHRAGSYVPKGVRDMIPLS